MKTQKSYSGCCLCNSTEFELITTSISFGIDILKCAKCNLIQSEYISDEALQDYYEEYYRGTLTETDFTEMRKLSHLQAASQMDYLISIMSDVPFKNVLEIGCGIGELAKALARVHGKVYVTEADPQYVALLKRERKLSYIKGCELKNERFSQYFDFIALSHVLEHLPDPITLLNDISRVLKKNGCLFIEVPNESDMLMSHNFQGKGHLYFYTIGTFAALISSQGCFDIVEIRTCNRTVQDYVASNFTLADDFSLKYSTNGTTIRALLVNKRPEASSNDSRQPNINHRMVAEEYSRRIVHLHQEILNLNMQMTSLQTKCQLAIQEAKQIVMNQLPLT